MGSVLRRGVLWSLITIGIVAAPFVMGQGRGGAAPAPAAGATDQTGFPDGDSKKFVMDNCAGCHGLDQVQAAKHEEAAWKETLSRMVTYGASITDAQVATVAAYLAKSFPAKPAEKKEDTDAAGEKILNTACTTCHDLGPITRRADDKSSWEGIVYGMVGNGADVKDAEIPILVDYLVKYYGPPKPGAAVTPAAPTAPAAPPAGGRGGRGGRD